MANSGKPCEEPWISAHGGLTSMTAWLASSCEKSTPKRDGRRGLSAVKSARNSRSFYAAEASAAQAATEDRVRFHICWGSWHGPHQGDVPLKDVVDLLLKVKAQAYVVEAGNVRHEHEWKVWKNTKLPQGKILIPGVVSHATNVLEHPELVADRLVRFAKVVGRENVLAGTDCGLGGRVHPQIAWAKLTALSEGAKLATKELWS